MEYTVFLAIINMIMSNIGQFILTLDNLIMFNSMGGFVTVSWLDFFIGFAVIGEIWDLIMELSGSD